MEIRKDQQEKGPLVAAILALVVLGMGSLLLTWRSIEHQRDIVMEHMLLSGRAIVGGVEASLVRLMRQLKTIPHDPQAVPPVVREMLQEITSTGEILFVALADGDGHVLISSAKEGGEVPIRFSDQALKSLDQLGTWHTMAKYGRKNTLVFAIRARPGISAVLEGNLPPEMLEGHGGLEPTTILLVGLNAEGHLAQFQQYRRAALFQTGYVFLAAVLLWFLAFAYLRRRDQGRRLVHLEQFQSRLLDSMPDGLVTLGPGGEILGANGAAGQLLCDNTPDCEKGRNGAMSLLGRTWDEFPFSPPHEQKEWEQCEYRGRHLEVLCLPFEDEQEEEGQEGSPRERYLVLVRDRTRIKSLEQNLHEARRLAAIGSLAAGVAHEVRNPLSSLRGFAQFFADKLRDEEPYASYSKTMVKEADRLNRVVTDLLYLARPRELAPQQVDLHEAAESLRRLLRFDLDHRHLEPGLDLQAPTVYADPDGLQQVLLNLLVNALESLENETGEIMLASRPAQGGVVIRVSDNGPGMDEETRQQAFEPFFTNKRKGTGLGLAIVQNIVSGHKGGVSIQSEPGRGTSIELFFPDQGEAPSEPRENAQTPDRSAEDTTS